MPVRQLSRRLWLGGRVSIFHNQLMSPCSCRGGALMSQPGRRMRILLLALAVCGVVAADPLDDLAREFWQWRAIHQPDSGDDMARIDRPADWTPDWSPQSVAQQKEALASFEKRWKEM